MSIVRRLSLLFGAVSTIIAVGAIAPVAASSPSVIALSGTTVGQTKVLYLSADKAFAIAVPASTAKKGHWRPDLDLATLGVKVTAPANFSVDGSGWPCCNPASLSNTTSQSVCPIGCGPIVATFSGSVPYCVPETCVTFNGNSHTEWDGTNPWNCDNIQDNNTYHVAGWGISFSGGGGAGGPNGSLSVSPSGDSVYWDTGVNNNWAVYDNWNNISFSAQDMTQAWEYDSGVYQMANQFYRTDTHDWAYV